MLKKILKRTLIVLGILIVILFTIPFLFKGKIIALVKKEINKNLNAKVDFKDVNISFFRKFPRVSVAIEDIRITGNDVFLADTLLQAKKLDAAVNIMSIIRGKDMKIYSVELESPDIHLIRLKEGFANWDIVKPEPEKDKPEEKGESKPFQLELQRYAINHAHIRFDDAAGGMSARIDDLYHQGKGDFTSDHFTLSTKTDAGSVSFTQGNIPYLAAVKTKLDADFDIDNTKGSYNFKKAIVNLNDLAVEAQGIITALANGWDMDLQFKAPSTEFKNILSLIPAIYKQDFDKLNTSGTGIFSGFVKGKYTDSLMPAYHLDMQVKNGFFQYKDLPKPVKDINFSAIVDNSDGQPDNLVVQVDNGHLVMDKDPFDFRLLLKKPETEMYVDAGAKGKLNLADVSSFMKLDKGTRLAGLIDADVTVKGSVNDAEAGHYDRFDASGNVDVNRFFYASADYPEGVTINTATAAFTPVKINLSNVNGQYQGTNFTAGGAINNLFSYLIKGSPLKADIAVTADKVNLNKLMGEPASTTTATAPAKTTGNTTATSASTAFVIPANLQVSLDTKVGQLQYDKFDIRNLEGNLKLADQGITFTNVKGNTLDGSMAINGSYSTKQSHTKPAIALKYDVTGVDIQKTFYAFNSAQSLMPIGKFLSGKLTSAMSANGFLGEGMNLDLSSLSGNGNLFLIEGFLSRFAPLDKIASVLNVPVLKDISLKDVKSYFEFANGKLLVKPFNLKVKDISMEIGGLQGFDQSLDYVINMKVPRALMGSQGNQLVNNLAQTINNKGIPFKVGETVNFILKLGGSFTNPTVKVDLNQTGQNIADQLKDQVKDFAQAKIDSAKKVITDTVKNLKEKLLQQAKDELIKKMKPQKDTATVKDSAAGNKPPAPKPADAVKGIFDNLLKKKKPAAQDTGKKN